MPGNTFGTLFRVTTFGESHGQVIGVVIDGCPAGLNIDLSLIQSDLDKRKPGNSPLISARKEEDQIEIISGLFEGKTTGAPLVFMVGNKDARPQDYEHLKTIYRPSHADFTYEKKYGVRDHRGGGRSSARETVARVIAGSVARQFLSSYRIDIAAYCEQIGTVRLSSLPSAAALTHRYDNPVRCPDANTAQRMQQEIEKVKAEGDTLGGIIRCVINGCPAGLGQPVFDKLHADLAKAMMSIPAVHGFEYGSGFDGAARKGSENNDEFFTDADGNILTRTNYSGGIQGGISNGMEIYFRVALKPASSLSRKQHTVDSSGQSREIIIQGRHDPCVVPRAVIIVESMAALVLADHLLRKRTDRV
jgi:chorismate synthase